jgi:ABC-type Mn2+/Zn2+ transport system permease subunit
MEELKGMLNGNVIWVRWEEVGIMFVVYSALGCLYFLLHERFLKLSTDHKSQIGHFGWEFIFFASFAVVITLAVNLAGVLLVFAALIIPAFTATFLTETFKKRLILGWLLGWLGALGGLIVSYEADLPTGSSVVCALSVLPVLALVVRYIRRGKKGELIRPREVA